MSRQRTTGAEFAFSPQLLNLATIAALLNLATPHSCSRRSVCEGIEGYGVLAGIEVGAAKALRTHTEVIQVSCKREPFLRFGRLFADWSQQRNLCTEKRSGAANSIDIDCRRE